MRIGAVQRKRYRNKRNLTPKKSERPSLGRSDFLHTGSMRSFSISNAYIKEAMFKGIAADIQKRRVDTLKTINLCRARVSLCRAH